MRQRRLYKVYKPAVGQRRGFTAPFWNLETNTLRGGAGARAHTHTNAGTNSLVWCQNVFFPSSFSKRTSGNRPLVMSQKGADFSKDVGTTEPFAFCQTDSSGKSRACEEAGLWSLRLEAKSSHSFSGGMLTDNSQIV